MSSTLFWFFQQVYTDGLNLKESEIKSFPLPDFQKLSADKLEKLEKIYTLYLKNIEQKANIRISSGNSSYNINSFKEYKIVRSIDIVHNIDDIICPLYELNQDETEYIRNYELEFRIAGL